MKALFCLTLTLLSFAFLNSTASGALKLSAKSGPYSFPSTWTDNLAPQPGDDIIIQTGHHVGGATGTVNNLTVEGTLTFSGLTVLGNLTLGPAGVMSPLHGGYQLFLKGSQITNNGVVNSQTRMNGDTTQTISGLGTWTAGGEFSGTGEKTIQNMIIPAGLWTVLNTVNVTGTWRLTGGSTTKPSTGTVQGNGVVLYDGSGVLGSNESAGNRWTVPITMTATVSVTTNSSVSAPILVGNTGTLSVSGNRSFEVKEDFTVESGGRVVGQDLRLSGVNILNNGDIQLISLAFNRSGDQAIAGGGLWQTTNARTIGGSGTKSLMNSTSMTGGSLIIESALNINNHTLNFTNGTFRKESTGSVTGTGVIQLLGNGILTSLYSAGNLFTAPIEIVSGTRGPNASSTFDGPMTVRTGATLNISANVIMKARGDLTIESGANVVGQFLEIYGPNFINHGTVTPVETRFKSGAHLLSGNGTFGSAVELESGSSTVLQGVQQFNALRVFSGSSFDISNATMKIGGTFTNAGTITTTGSTIEYNRENGDQNVVTNIDYYNLVINNPRRVFLHSPETVEHTLRLERGTFEIFTNHLTMADCAQIIYAGGVLNGTPILGSCDSTFTVTNLNDSGAGSLRQATVDANANAGNDTIDMSGLTGMIALTSGPLDISDSVTINGPAANQLTLSGENANRIFVLSSSGNDPFVVAINGLTVANGHSLNCGGAIYASDVELSLNELTVTTNNALDGAGICFDGGTLKINSSSLHNNFASGNGGGIQIQSATAVSIINSTVSENSASSGGGIQLISGTANIVNSTISHNNALVSGGGVFNDGTINMRNTIVAVNQSTEFPDVAGEFNSLGNNLIGTDPNLGELQYNGGPTKTRALLAGSPAINAGDNCVLTSIANGGCVETPLLFDQRGTSFPRSVGNTVDIGAFEAPFMTE